MMIDAKIGGEDISTTPAAGKPAGSVSFSILFYTDVREDVSDTEKLNFIRDATLFADKAGFASVYMPERHFHDKGCLYPDPAVLAAFLAPQTKVIRFRTAGLSLPLHHPASIVESWALVDQLSGGRVDLGFGNGGTHRPVFTLAPDAYEDRRSITSTGIPIVQKLWRGESVSFPGPGGENFSITVHPRPIQKEVAIWLLVVQNDEAFAYAGRQGYNIMTMLYGVDLEAIGRKIVRYRDGRREGGHNPETGIVSIMLHTLVVDDYNTLSKQLNSSFKPFVEKLTKRTYAMEHNGKPIETLSYEEQARRMAHSYNEHLKNGGIFGSISEARQVVDKAISVGVNDIALLLDFGVDYDVMRKSFSNLEELVSLYLGRG
ncbi:MAG: luciferase-like monooxygenase [Verrucomicrobiales bacterium]|nr:luciferase-like monooxygenase [Verrucomicrobiales bacterium]